MVQKGGGDRLPHGRYHTNYQSLHHLPGCCFQVKLEFEEDDAKSAEYKQTNGTHTRTTHARTTDWEHENDRNLWFTEPAHLVMNGTRRSDDTDMVGVGMGPGV